MLKGLYLASSGMLTNQNQLDIIANNLSNVSTTGFKQDQGINYSFPEVLMSRLEGKRRPESLGRLGTGVSLKETSTDFQQGSLRQTGNQLDLAITGNGFFVVETPTGTRYTRNGNFTLNQRGQIVTQQGYPVMGERGVLQTINGRDIKIDGNGQLYLGDLQGDRFLIVDFPERGLLEKTGDNLYQSLVEPEELREGYKLSQGFLEDSNVKIVQEMVKMIEASRLYEANQRVITTIDNTLDKVVNSVGKI